MTGWQESPGSLYIDPAATDGVYLVYKSGVRFTRFLRLVDGSNTTVTIDTSAGTASVSSAAPATPVPVVSVVNGVPGLVFDNDGSVVYRKVSP